MGCRCGQNQQQPAGAAQFMAPVRSFSQDQGPSAGVDVWYVVTTETGTTTFGSMEAAIAFAGGEYPITRTTFPPPQPVGPVA